LLPSDESEKDNNVSVRPDPSNDLPNVMLNDTVTDTTDRPNDLLIDAQEDASDMTAAISGRMDCQLEFVSGMPANKELMANDLGNFVTEGSSISQKMVMFWLL